MLSFWRVFIFYKRQLWNNENVRIWGQKIWISLPALLHANNFSSVVLVSSCIKIEKKFHTDIVYYSILYNLKHYINMWHNFIHLKYDKQTIFDSMITLDITIFQIHSCIHFPHNFLVGRRCHLKNANQPCHSATSGKMEFSIN